MLTRINACLAIAASLLVSTPHAALVELTGAARLSVGGAHACVVTTAGAVKCWGDNHYGQLGDGTTGNSRSSAGEVVGLANGVTQVAAAASMGRHSCALMASGAVRCWGANDRGQLGDGSTVDKATPVDVQGLGGPAAFISTGYRHTCAIRTDGVLKCWGSNEFGQLGDGTTGDAHLPVNVAGITGNIAHVSAGYAHTCAVTSSGAALCWGSNLSGQLGDGTTISRLVPGPVASLPSGVAEISAAGAQATGIGFRPQPPIGHSCALMAGGSVKCWGSNAGGEIGDGTRTDHLTPIDAVGLANGVANVEAGGGGYYIADGINAAIGFTCATTLGGTVKCWGTNYCGLLGDGTTPICSAFSGPIPNAVTPTSVVGLTHPAIAVSVGSLFNCALLDDTRVECWGSVPGYAYPQGQSAVPVMTGTLPQAIVFGMAPTVAIGGTGTLAASGGASGNPVVFTSLTPATCTVGGATVSGLASGMCTVAANQSGNIYYDAAAQATQTFRVGPPVAQTITFGPAPSLTVGGAGNLVATASSGLAVAFASNTPSVCAVVDRVVTGLAVGSCTVVASQAGDALYAAAPQVTQTFAVGANDGTFGLVVRRSGAGSGSVSSSPAGIDCGATCGANFANGSVVSLAHLADADAVFRGWSGACTGTGACVVTMNGLKDVTATFASAAVIPRLGNISTRAQVLGGDNALIGGFVIQGSAPKTVVIRARGPSLSAFGITGALENPRLDLYSNGTLLQGNDDWHTAANASALVATGFAPGVAAEAAILATLSPGAYTGVVSGSGAGTGIGIVEVFEVDRPEAPLINISTRGHVGTDNDVMIAGFIIQGDGPKSVVVRARGPSLAAFGVPDPLANPTLELFSGPTQIASNDNWPSDANATQLFSSGFAPSDTREAALLVTLNPGAYTAIVRGSGGTTGVAIVEVFAQ